MAFGWVKKAAKSAGRSVSKVAKTAGKGVNAGIKITGKIPVVGKPLKSALNIAAAPMNMTVKVIGGANVGKAALGTLRDTAQNVRDVAPYVRAIVAQVPGVGTGIAAGLSASMALAEGQNITAALIAGVKGAVPGGIVGQAAFQKAFDATAGKVVNQATLTNLLKGVPAAAQKAFTIGVAMGNAKTLQAANNKGIVDPMAIATLKAEGLAIVVKTPIYQAQRKTLKGQAPTGYIIGHGLMSHSGVNEAQIVAIRKKLTPEQAKGFDVALSIRVGALSGKQPPSGLSTAGRAAFYTTQGMAEAAPEQKAEMMKTIIEDPSAKAGAVAAIATMPKTQQGLWAKIVAFLTGKK